MTDVQYLKQQSYQSQAIYMRIVWLLKHLRLRTDNLPHCLECNSLINFTTRAIASSWKLWRIISAKNVLYIYNIRHHCSGGVMGCKFTGNHFIYYQILITFIKNPTFGKLNFMFSWQVSPRMGHTYQANNKCPFTPII